MAKTKVIEIDLDEGKAQITLKRFTFGEKNDLIEQATKVSYVGGKENISLSSKILKESALLKGITNAPFEINLANIQNLDPDVAEQLYDELDSLNTLKHQKK